MRSPGQRLPENRIRPTIRRRAIAIGLIGAIACLTYAIFGMSRETRHGVATAPVVRADIEDVITATGKIQPRAYVDVGAQASGQLRRIMAQIGDSVTAGQPLAEIDPQIQSAKVEADRAEIARLEAVLGEQRAMLEFAEAQLARSTQLLPTNAISRSVFDENRRDAKMGAAKVDAMRAQIQQMQSTLKADEIALGYTKIAAPMAGTVVSIDGREGQTLNATYTTPQILRIADLTTMTVWTQVSEADVVRLRVGMKVYFKTLGHTDRRWNATLRQILPAPAKPELPSSANQSMPMTASPATNNVVLYVALFDIDNAEGELRPEMTAQVFFVAASARNALTVPIAAIKIDPDDGRPLVDVAKASGSIESRRVSLGVRTRFTAQVLEGVEEGEQVVTGARQTKAESSLVRFRL